MLTALWKFNGLPTTRFAEEKLIIRKTDGGRIFFLSSFLSALWIGEKLSIPAQDFFRKIDVGTSFSWSNRKARSEIPWVVKPYEGYYCVVLDFFLRCFGRPGRREHSKHSEIPIIHKCRQDIGLNVQMVPIRCTGVVCHYHKALRSRTHLLWH